MNSLPSIEYDLEQLTKNLTELMIQLSDKRQRAIGWIETAHARVNIKILRYFPTCARLIPTVKLVTINLTRGLTAAVRPQKRSHYSVISTKKILKASNVKKVHPIFNQISEELSKVEVLGYIKIYNGRIMASNRLSENRKKEPIVSVGAPNIVGVELLIDVPNKIIQFYSITSSIKGCGDKMVSSIVNAAPDDWELVIVMDWSGGFWKTMMERYPRLVVF